MTFRRSSLDLSLLFLQAQKSIKKITTCTKKLIQWGVLNVSFQASGVKEFKIEKLPSLAYSKDINSNNDMLKVIKM